MRRPEKPFGARLPNWPAIQIGGAYRSAGVPVRGLQKTPIIEKKRASELFL